MTTDPIAAARALIEPLTGYTPGSWKQGQNNPDRVSKGGEYIANCNPTHQSHPRTENNARLIAAAPDLRDMVATLADALEAERAENLKACAHLASILVERDALVAAAFEAVEGLCKRRYRYYEQMVAKAERSGPSRPEYICDSTFHHWSGQSSAYCEIATDIRNLTPDDAQAALNKLLAEARLEGWRAGRDAAAKIVDETAKYHMSDPDEIEVVRLTAAEIRALPETKEASHG